MQDKEMAAYVVWSEYYDQLAKFCRYVKGRGNGPAEHKHATSFYTVAGLCLDKQIDPRHYVATVIEILRTPLAGDDTPRNIITPKDIATNDAYDKYKRRMSESLGTNGATQWQEQELQLRRFRLMHDGNMSDEDILRPLYAPFDSWFKLMYIKPASERMFRLYGQLAWEELRIDRLLREYLRQHCPENMAELERRIARFEDTPCR